MNARLLEHTAQTVHVELLAFRQGIREAQTVDEIEAIREVLRQLALDILGTSDAAAVKADLICGGVFATKG